MHLKTVWVPKWRTESICAGDRGDSSLVQGTEAQQGEGASARRCRGGRQGVVSGQGGHLWWGWKWLWPGSGVPGNRKLLLVMDQQINKCPENSGIHVPHK